MDFSDLHIQTMKLCCTTECLIYCWLYIFSSKGPVKVPFDSVRLAPKQTAQSVEFKEGDEVEVGTQHSINLSHFHLPMACLLIFSY
jgi:hypothetical protein